MNDDKIITMKSDLAEIKRKQASKSQASKKDIAKSGGNADKVKIASGSSAKINNSVSSGEKKEKKSDELKMLVGRISKTIDNKDNKWYIDNKKEIREKLNVNKKTMEDTNNKNISHDNHSLSLKSTKKTGEKKYYNDEGYVSPENRLSKGKQEFYSAAFKKTEPKKEKEEDLEKLKTASSISKKKQPKAISKDEEYEKLKKSIAKKYSAKHSRLPISKNKIIFAIAVLFLFAVSIAAYFVFIRKPEIKKDNNHQEIYVYDLKEFSKLDEKDYKIEAQKSEIEKLGIFEINVNKVFLEKKGANVLKLNIKDGEKNLKLEEALSEIGIEIENLPTGFLASATGNYNIFVFREVKEKNNVVSGLRFGVAVESNDIQLTKKIMEKWEKENIPKNKIYKVLKPLFINDHSNEVEKPFNSNNYKGIKIRFMQVPNKYTSIDYFIYNNLLIITTSKDSAFKIIDLLTN